MVPFRHRSWCFSGLKGVFIPWQKPWDGKARVSKKGSGFELKKGHKKGPLGKGHTEHGWGTEM